MAKSIKIDGKDYDLDDLSDSTKGQLASLQATDQEIKRLEQRLAIAKTARKAYAQAAQSGLAEEPKTKKKG